MYMKRFRRLVITGLVLYLSISISCFSTIFVQASNGSEPLTLNHRVHADESMIWVMAEVINNLNVPIGNLSVKVSFYNDNQDILRETSTTAWLSVILPNRRAPFVVGINKKDVEGFADCTVELEHYEQRQDKPLGLTINTASLIAINAQGVWIRGEVENSGLEKTNFIIVIGMFYDDKGFLAADSHILSLPEGLLPGVGEAFEVHSKFVNASSNLMKYVLTAESVGGGQSASYGIEQEYIKEFATSQDQNVGYDAIIVILVTIASVIVVTVAASRSKRKSHRTKRSISRKSPRKSRLAFRSDRILKERKWQM